MVCWSCIVAFEHCLWNNQFRREAEINSGPCLPEQFVFFFCRKGTSILLHISNTPLELMEYCQKNGIAVEAYSPIAHGEILNQPEIKAMAEKYGVTVPQLCIRYTLQLGAISLPKTANPEHMKTNAEVDFEISAEDMEVLKHFKKIENYGDSSAFPVYGGKM